jgi:hypothetical protein
MNPDTKRFEPVADSLPPTDKRALWPTFKIGQEFEVNGVAFVVRKVTNKDLVLRPKR